MNWFVTFAVVAPWTLIGIGCWLFSHLLRQNGRILLRLESIENHLNRMTDAREGARASSNGHRPLSESRIERGGLQAGTPAPDFRLPLLDGGELSLSELRGKKVLLVFSDPNCGPCDSLAPKLRELHKTAQGSRSPIHVLMVCRGEIGENRKKARQHGLTFPIVLQKKWEISKLYAMFATPVGYLINEEGKTLFDVAVGGDAIINLATKHELQRNGVDSAPERLSA